MSSWLTLGRRERVVGWWGGSTHTVIRCLAKKSLDKLRCGPGKEYGCFGIQNFFVKFEKTMSKKTITVSFNDFKEVSANDHWNCFCSNVTVFGIDLANSFFMIYYSFNMSDTSFLEIIIACAISDACNRQTKSFNNSGKGRRRIPQTIFELIMMIGWWWEILKAPTHHSISIESVNSTLTNWINRMWNWMVSRDFKWQHEFQYNQTC